MSTGFDGRDELLEAYLAKSGEEDLGEAFPHRMWADGRAVGEWMVTGFLARGGSAEVYCAKHRRLGTRAALKVLWRDGAGPLMRFEKETRFMMGNPGPSFPAFYGAGVDGGRPWVAMELLDECPMPTTDGEVARYLLDVGSGVAVLHARGWLHRDLKPRNILRRADGHAVLADFGLLKAIGEAETTVVVESPSIVNGREVGVGTPGWSAPEQFFGGGATPAADVYALGMLAEECFGGNPPRAWEKIIRRATAALPRQRYPGVAPMLRAIRRRHRPRHVAWALLACVLAVVAAALGWWAAWKPKPQLVADAGPKVVLPRPPELPSVVQPSPEPGSEVVAPPRLEEEMVLPNDQEESVDVRESVVPASSVESATSPVETMAPTEEGPVSGIGRLGVPAERAAALARFEADEERKEVILALVDDMVPFSSYRVGRHKVTQRQWMALMEDNPSRFKGENLPVDSLTFGACLEFLERLNSTSIVKGEGWTFRLPSVGEWMEVAQTVPCKTQKARLKVGWYAENGGGWTHAVGEKSKGTDFADLYGNVRELTRTWGKADGEEGFLCMGGGWADSLSEGDESMVLAQPQLIRRHLERFDHAAIGVDIVPSDYPHAVCPAPGEIGFRLWAGKTDTSSTAMSSETLKHAVEYWENEGRRQ